MGGYQVGIWRQNCNLGLQFWAGEGVGWGTGRKGLRVDLRGHEGDLRDDDARALRPDHAAHRGLAAHAVVGLDRLHELRIVVEPGGAAAFAALLSRRYEPRAGERVGVVLSGGNTVAVDFGRS